MHVAAHCIHAARPASKTPAESGDALRKRIHYRPADYIGKDCKEGFQFDHTPMMALSVDLGKAGKPGYSAR
jgi:hypothetical protein